MNYDEKKLNLLRSQIYSTANETDSERSNDRLLKSLMVHGSGILEKSFSNQIRDLLTGRIHISGVKSIQKNTKISYEQIENLDIKSLLNINISEDNSIRCNNFSNSI